MKKNLSTGSYVYALILIVLSMICSLGSLFYYRFYETEKIDETTNKYHLATILYCTQIKEELLHILTDYSYIPQFHYTSENLPEIDIAYTNKNSIRLIDEKLKVIQLLHRKYNNPAFTGTLNRLTEDYNLLKIDFENHNGRDLINSVDVAHILVHLENLQRLHLKNKNSLEITMRKNKETGIRESIIIVTVILFLGSLIILKILSLIKKNEAALKKSENTLLNTNEFLQKIIDYSTNAIYAIDLEGNFTFMNTKGAEIAGYHVNELISQPFSILFTEKTLPDVYEQFIQCSVHGDTVLSYETVIVRKDKNRRNITFSIAPLYKDGAIESIVGTADDITERKKAENAMRKSEERFRTLISNIPGVSYRCALDKDWTMEFMSNAVFTLSGYPPSDFINNKVRSYADIIHPDDTDQVEKVVLEAVNNKEPFYIQYRIIHRDGEIRWVYERGQAVFNENNEVSSLDGVIIDDTLRKEMEKDLQELNRNLEKKVAEETERRRHKEQLLIQQSKMASMGEMLGAIAHQWRQPLNMIGVLIQELTDSYEYNEFSRETLYETVAEAMKQIQYMSGTIDDFRNFFRPSKESLPFDIGEAVNSVLNIVSIQFTNHDIKIGLPPVEEKIVVNGYENEFKQVLLNLINNAKDAIGRKYHHSIDPEKGGEIELTVSSDNNKVLIKVKDNGGGIPDRIFDRIFEPYFTTDIIKGTGIGLYMSKIIIEDNMNGRLYAKNVTNGAEFTIELKSGVL